MSTMFCSSLHMVTSAVIHTLTSMPLLSWCWNLLLSCKEVSVAAFATNVHGKSNILTLTEFWKACAVVLWHWFHAQLNFSAMYLMTTLHHVVISWAAAIFLPGKYWTWAHLWGLAMITSVALYSYINSLPYLLNTFVILLFYSCYIVFFYGKFFTLIAWRSLSMAWILACSWIGHHLLVSNEYWLIFKAGRRLLQSVSNRTFVIPTFPVYFGLWILAVAACEIAPDASVWLSVPQFTETCFVYGA